MHSFCWFMGDLSLELRKDSVSGGGVADHRIRVGGNERTERESC